MGGILVVAAVVLLAGPVLAQTLPQSSGDPLQEICTGFLQQSGAGISGDHQRLCTCLVSETQKQLTRPEMEAYYEATQTGQQPSPAIMQKVVGIATTCLTQAR